jgi:hypothetical protein
MNNNEPEQRQQFTEVIANMMKKNFLNWNRDSVNDEVVFDHLVILSEGQLKVKENTTLRSTNDILKTNRVNTNNHSNQNQKHKHKFKKHKKHF